MKQASLYIFSLLFALLWGADCSAQMKDSDRLGMAIDYFQTAKYHEALLILQDLDSHYKLNPRFKAYLGVCHYYEWNYKEAAAYLDETLPQLQGVAPHELSFYLFAAGESHFALAQYAEAANCYSQQLPLCYNNEKGDVYFKIGFCHLSEKDYLRAREALNQSLSYYRGYRNTPDMQARITQIENMVNGCEAMVELQLLGIDHQPDFQLSPSP